MGLAICRTIIETHGGRLWLECPPEGGSSLLSFAAGVRGRGLLMAPQSGEGTIFVVDDDPAVRELRSLA